MSIFKIIAIGFFVGVVSANIMMYFITRRPRCITTENRSIAKITINTTRGNGVAIITMLRGDSAVLTIPKDASAHPEIVKYKITYE